MLEALFIAGVDDITVSGLTQWDRGQTVQITCPDLPELFQIHFANRKSKKAIVTSATAAGGVTVVTLPDELLREPYELIAWLYYNDGINGETVKTIHFPVERRKKPDDYVVALPSEQITDAEKVITKLLDEYIDKATEKHPVINTETGTWMVWNAVMFDYVDTGVAATLDITFGTTDLTPGVSPLAAGKVYFVYEEA